ASRGLAPPYGPTRERLSACLFIGALGANFRICRVEVRPGVSAAGAGRLSDLAMAAGGLAAAGRVRGSALGGPASAAEWGRVPRWQWCEEPPCALTGLGWLQRGQSGKGLVRAAEAARRARACRAGAPVDSRPCRA